MRQSRQGPGPLARNGVRRTDGLGPTLRDERRDGRAHSRLGPEVGAPDLSALHLGVRPSAPRRRYCHGQAPKSDEAPAEPARGRNPSSCRGRHSRGPLGPSRKAPKASSPHSMLPTPAAHASATATLQPPPRPPRARAPRVPSTRRRAAARPSSCRNRHSTGTASAPAQRQRSRTPCFCTRRDPRAWSYKVETSST